jgi:hypothetical protein
MPRRQDHVIIAFILILFSYLVLGLKSISNWTFLATWVCFFIGSLAPDYLEPAHYFTHRKFFHSKNLLRILSILAIVLFDISLVLKSILLYSITAFLAGYIGHLILDSTTKMGLPEYNKNQPG